MHASRQSRCKNQRFNNLNHTNNPTVCHRLAKRPALHRAERRQLRGGSGGGSGPRPAWGAVKTQRRATAAVGAVVGGSPWQASAV